MEGSQTGMGVWQQHIVEKYYASLSFVNSLSLHYKCHNQNKADKNQDLINLLV